jgi:hypothetical protein
MAYKYFTEKLLSSGIDTSDVFPEKQEIARENNNVSYNLGDIAIYIKDVTDNFKVSENQYIELDNAISEIVAKWYKSKGENNPFVEEIDAEAALKEFASNTPREAAIVDKGDLKSKGAPASAPSSTKTKEPKEKFEEKVVEVVEPKLSDSEKIQNLKADLERARKIYYEVLDEDEQATYLRNLEKRLVGAETIAEDGDEYLVQRYNVLKDFVNSYK